MENKNENVVSVLNELIEYNKDGQQGYSTAAKDVKNPQLKSLFSDFISQRSGFVTNLKEAVRSHGGDPEKTGSATGAAHRAWINIKSAVEGGDEKAILAECDLGDSAAEAKYDEILKKDLPQDVKKIVQEQHNAIRDARNKIRSLKEVAH